MQSRVYSEINFCIFEQINDAMTIVIERSNAKNTSEILRKKLNKAGKSGNLSRHFGKLKRNLDGLEYQSTIRENEG